MELTEMMTGCLLYLDHQHAQAGPGLQCGPTREQEVAEGVRGPGERGIQEVPGAGLREGETEGPGDGYEVPGGETPRGQTGLFLS